VGAKSGSKQERRYRQIESDRAERADIRRQVQAAMDSAIAPLIEDVIAHLQRCFACKHEGREVTVHDVDNLRQRKLYHCVACKTLKDADGSPATSAESEVARQMLETSPPSRSG
jgi:hypothetical protein